MPSPIVEIRGLKELQARMQSYPRKLNEAIRTTMQAGLLVLWENVPPYPPQPQDSTYVRTGTLGRTLGASIDGGRAGGKPDIYEVREMGGNFEGHFGSSLDYAPYVIGDDTQASQNSHWWKISDIAARAQEKIDKLFEKLADKLAKFLEGQGS